MSNECCVCSSRRLKKLSTLGQSTRDASIRELLDKLRGCHESLAHKLGEGDLTKTARAKEDETARRMFMLRYVQPGFAGLMDGSVLTLAPLFAAAFATHNTWQTFLVGIAASVGTGISMAFAEALSDGGSLTGRGAPVLRAPSPAPSRPIQLGTWISGRLMVM